MNRYGRALDLSLDPDLGRETSFRLYRYSRADLPRSGGDAPGPAGEVGAAPGRPAALRIPEESFILLTEER